jgi:hypothetical protein
VAGTKLGLDSNTAVREVEAQALAREAAAKQLELESRLEQLGKARQQYEEIAQFASALKAACDSRDHAEIEIVISQKGSRKWILKGTGADKINIQAIDALYQQAAAEAHVRATALQELL